MLVDVHLVLDDVDNLIEWLLKILILEEIRYYCTKIFREEYRNERYSDVTANRFSCAVKKWD